MGDCGFRPMPRINNGLRRESKDFCANPLEEQRAISTRQIPAAHPLAEEDIPSDELAGFWKVKTQTSRTMAWNVKGGKLQSCYVGDLPFLQQAVGLNRLHINVEAVLFKKIPILHHRNRIGVKCYLASVATLDQCGIRHMIKVAVGEQKPIDFLIRKMSIRALWSVEENVPLWGFKQKGICKKRPASKNFELNHAICCL